MIKRHTGPIRNALLLACLSVCLVGCVEMLSAVGTGAVVTVEYVTNGAVTETVNYEFPRTKKALLVALCNMQITVDQAKEIDQGEEITAKAKELNIQIELKEITPKLTRIAVSAQKHLLSRDKATAREILSETQKIAENLIV